jgi:CHAD domain-containing protein
MAYALDLRLTPASELCRVVREECRYAKARLRRRGDQLSDSVHEARRALRRVRAALLLVRPALDVAAYEAALAPWRAAGRHLCAQRDADSAIEALGRLRQDAPALLSPAALLHLQRGLHRRRDRLARNGGAQLDAAIEDLARAQRAIAGWTAALTPELLWRGVRQGHARAARATRLAAGAAPDDPAWHRFRQRVRAHWLQLELLRPLWPALVGAQAQEARRLSQLLGRERDLLLLDQRLVALRGELASDCSRVQARASLAQLRVHMRDRAQAQAAVAFSEGARAFVRRLRNHARASALPVRADGDHG